MKRTGASCFGLLITLLGIITWLASMRSSHIEDKGLALVDEANKLMHMKDPASIQKAAQDYKKAADIFHGMENKEEDYNEGIAYYDLARAYHALNQNTSAIAAGQSALPLFHNTNTDTKLQKAQMYNNLGLYYTDADQPDKAMDAYKQAETLYTESGKTEARKQTVSWEAGLLYNQAARDAKKHNWPNALTASLQSLTLYQQAEDTAGEADTYHKIGLIYTVMKDSPKAAAAFHQEQTLRASLKAASK